MAPSEYRARPPSPERPSSYGSATTESSPSTTWTLFGAYDAAEREVLLDGSDRSRVEAALLETGHDVYRPISFGIRTTGQTTTGSDISRTNARRPGLRVLRLGLTLVCSGSEIRTACASEGVRVSCTRLRDTLQVVTSGASAISRHVRMMRERDRSRVRRGEADLTHTTVHSSGVEHPASEHQYAESAGEDPPGGRDASEEHARTR